MHFLFPGNREKKNMIGEGWFKSGSYLFPAHDRLRSIMQSSDLRDILNSQVFAARRKRYCRFPSEPKKVTALPPIAAK